MTFFLEQTNTEIVPFFWTEDSVFKIVEKAPIMVKLNSSNWLPFYYKNVWGFVWVQKLLTHFPVRKLLIVHARFSPECCLHS